MHIKKIGQGKDLVLIHGWGMHSGIWEPIIEKFSNQYTLHLVDIPGMGKSDSIDPYDLNHLAEAISQKLPTSFDILGWSLGSLIALKMSLLHPQKIHRMVLVGGTPRFINQTDWSHGVDIKDFNDFANKVMVLACNEVSPVLVINTYPVAPKMSPKSIAFLVMISQ